MGHLYLFVGDSGSGKTTIANELEKRGLSVVSSYTTRPPRHENEKGHIFISEKELEVLKANEEIVAETTYNGNWYGATKRQVDASDIYIINRNEVINFMKTYERPVVIIEFLADEETLKSRLTARSCKHSSVERIAVDAEERLHDDADLWRIRVSTSHDTIENTTNLVLDIINFFNQCKVKTFKEHYDL